MNIGTILGDAVGVAANPVTGLAKVAFDLAPEIASWFGDDAEAAVTKIGAAVKTITGTDDPTQAKTALADPNLIFQLRQQAAQIAHEERMAELGGPVRRVGVRNRAPANGQWDHAGRNDQ